VSVSPMSVLYAALVTAPARTESKPDQSARYWGYITQVAYIFIAGVSCVRGTQASRERQARQESRCRGHFLDVYVCNSSQVQVKLQQRSRNCMLQLR
jgi:hypothetical protein